MKTQINKLLTNSINTNVKSVKELIDAKRNLTIRENKLSDIRFNLYKLITKNVTDNIESRISKDYITSIVNESVDVGLFLNKELKFFSASMTIGTPFDGSNLFDFHINCYDNEKIDFDDYNELVMLITSPQFCNGLNVVKSDNLHVVVDDYNKLIGFVLPKQTWQENFNVEELKWLIDNLNFLVKENKKQIQIISNIDKNDFENDNVNDLVINVNNLLKIYSSKISKKEQVGINGIILSVEYNKDKKQNGVKIGLDIINDINKMCNEMNKWSIVKIINLYNTSSRLQITLKQI